MPDSGSREVAGGFHTEAYRVHLLASATQKLEAAGVESARLEAQLLLAQALGVTRTTVLAGTFAEPTPQQRAEFDRLTRARAQRIPLAYLRGTQEFYALDFEVTPAVLIPRPETELLVEFARTQLSSARSARIADMGTGSGCIAVSVLKHCPAAHAIATDLSADALAIARRNAVRHDVADRVRFIRTDTLEGVSGPLDLVLSNPPYIPTREILALQPEVRDREPRLALDGGADGLDTHRKLAQQAAALLRPGGGIAIETAMGQAAQVAELLERAGFSHIAIQTDFAGIERMVSGHHSASPRV